MDPTPISLLERLCEQARDEDWSRLCHLYEPWIRSWILREPGLRQEVDDLTQEVLRSVFLHVRDFQRQRAGSFRKWLRVITLNRVRQFWRDRPSTRIPSTSVLDQLEDPRSDLSQIWDREHDRFLASRMLELVAKEFTETTWEAFRLHALEGLKAREAATRLGISDNAVLVATSRIMKRLRSEAKGFIDFEKTNPT